MHKKYFILPLLCLALACKQKTVTNLHAVTSTKDTVKLPPVSAAQLIDPGKSIGLTHLNESLDSVSLKLGKADRGDAAMGAAFTTWFAKHDTSGYQTDVYSHRMMGGKDDNTSRVKLIRVTSPYFKTIQGVGTGLTLTEIGKHFHVKHIANYITGTDTLKVYDDTKEGISFEIDKGDKCTGVLIHAPKDAASGYLSMHPNAQYVMVKK
ncbi:hypothetical protein [Mucilaginibacter polytrichastri]|uniref:Lipoprotein n=1 Tax=Mucilaginibacter polytrichastri TaxID=1302689 RepID=A0A1Q6A3J8_9SPHI|nr:hypothetical protein [Mucilaginibacter polytrichastri]OKS88585.1 hypothetical protein RG47T_4056 [Mucilaginibacter polytrichastri]SFT11339.1 hypothetical protein SAMN04487890_11132 [Mucilaginibacter polytrichastri]